MRRERHSAKLRSLFREQISLNGGGDGDLALQPLFLGDVRQKRGDRLGHAVERLRHFAELVVRLHADAVAEVPALDGLGPFLDSIHRA